MVGDDRWAGSWGVDADFVAGTRCSMLVVPAESIRVSCVPFSNDRVFLRF